MSTQRYSFEFIKPRSNNPTYLSSSIASSFSIYNLKKMNNQENPIIRIQAQGVNQQNNSHRNQKGMKSSQSDFTLPKINKIQGQINLKVKQKVHTRSNSQNFERYGQNTLQYSPQMGKYQGGLQNSQKRASSFNNLPSQKRQVYKTISKNNLINLNQKDIFMKQCHNYNIITYEPKPYNEHIKKYPKLSLQQKDEYYRMRYINSNQYQSILKNQQQQNPQQPQNARQEQPTAIQQLTMPRQQPDNPRKSNNSSLRTNSKLAGMHTYRVRNIQPPPNDCSESNGNNRSNPTTGRKFDMKLLSHVDQFNYYA